MQTTRLGNSDLELSSIGFGTWALGGGGWRFSWGPQDDRDSISALRAAVDAGINWIDTAPAYGVQGHAETVVGRAIRDIPRTERPLLATKCGRQWTSDTELVPNLNAEWINREIDQSLQRLGVETIDLYQIHWPDPDEKIEEAWTAIVSNITKGKLRYAGVCNFSVTQLRRLQAIHPVTSLQAPYSMLRRDIETELLPFCREHQLGVLAYSPLQKGLLSGGMTRQRVDDFPADDHRRNDPMFHRPRLDIALEFVEHFRAIAAEQGRSPAELALAWVIRRPEITSAIAGGRSAVQIRESAGAGNWHLDDASVTRIEELLAELTRRLDV